MSHVRREALLLQPSLVQHMINMQAGSAGTEGLPPDGLPQFPPELTEELKQDEGFLQKLHTTLFDVHLLEGTLVCPEVRARAKLCRPCWRALVLCSFNVSLMCVPSRVWQRIPRGEGHPKHVVE